MKKRIKIKQSDITDCGAACIASIAAHYKLYIPVSSIRQYAGTDKRGTNILGLITAAEKLGFQVKGAKGNFESLAKIPLPAIAHVVLKNQLQHYVVIYKVTQKCIFIMDPSDGRIHKRMVEQFKGEWTGVIVLIIPDDGFIPEKKMNSNIQRFWKLIQPHRYIMLEAAIGALVYTVLGLSFSVYLQKIIDFVLVEGNLRLLNLLSIAMIALLSFQIVIGYFKSLFALRTGQHIDARLILGYYTHLLKLPQRFFDTMRVGEIISRINDAVKIRTFVNEIALNIIVNFLIIGFSIGFMFLYYWKLAVIMIAIVPVYIFIYLASDRINKKWQRTLMENTADLENQLVESLNAVSTIKRFHLEKYSNIKTENRFIVLLRSIYKTGIYGLYIGNVSDFFTRLFTIVLLWTGSYFVINRELSPGELLSFYALIGYFTGPAVSLMTANRSMHDALIAADRLFEIIDLEIETTDENKIELTPAITGDIRFNDVRFCYGTRVQVFEKFSLEIKKGISTAIVGESGSGKTTLLSLLQNIYPIEKGSITIGGFDLRHISNTSLRRIVSVVPQHIDLFHGTIIENIAIGQYEPDIQKIIELSKLTGINEFVEKMPDNYYTVLNEQGVNLSGGQRQRLAIVRALYRDPHILILDEATSNLDPESEQKVQQALRWFKEQGKTIIIIAHRLTTVKNCDWIVVLDGGKLAEEGTSDELIAKEGYYKRLWRYNANSI